MKRKTIHIGGSLAITLPKAWAKNQYLKKGDTIEVDVEPNFVLIRPIRKQPKRDTK